jgi:(S)-2-hydroxyglutarate dehydrogenase
MTTDVVIVGAGIVGLATARALLLADPKLQVTVLDKEPGIAAHQTGRNSNVVHSGIYYKPGSLKARYAIAGGRFLADYCAERGIAYEQTGKVIVATDADERVRLAALAERGREHGLAVRELTPGELAEREPAVRAVAALLVPSTAITDYPAVAAAYRDDVVTAGGTFVLSDAVTAVEMGDAEVTVRTQSGREHRARLLVNCAGLYSDVIARLSGERPEAQIVPFRGEYAELVPHRRELVRSLIYPVPDPRFPFLGVHFTRGVDGGVHAGPNAVLALRREGYTRWTTSRSELAELLRFPGTRHLARKYWRTGLEEYTRSFSQRAMVKALQRLVPDLRLGDLVAAPAGVRAQAVAPDGTLLDDFVIMGGRRAVHVLNAPSPAATASQPIGEHVARLALERLAA